MNKKILKIILIMLLFFFVLSELMFIRSVNPKELDDVSPEINCSLKLLKKADVLWIIPNFNNASIAQNKIWCDYIKSFNKTLGLHGVYHTFEEFSQDRNQEYLDEGIISFKNCFGFKPKLFKPPQLKISENNKKLIEKNNMLIKTTANQITRKVYHCSDTGLLPNRFIDFF